MFSMSLLRSGLERRFGGLGVPGVSRSTEPTQSKFLSVFVGAHFADAQRCFEVHQGKGGGVEQEA